MRRVFCDGCWVRGEQNDLTETHDYSRVPFLGSHTIVLDLCAVHSEVYERFEQQMKESRREHADQFKKLADQAIATFWQEVKAHGGEKEELIHTTQTGRKVRARERSFGG